MAEVADLWVSLRAISDEFVAGVDEAGDAAERTDGKLLAMGSAVAKLALGTTIAAGAIGVEAVKMATTFQAEMEKLSTLAQVPQSSIAGLSNSVLSLAGKVGADPDSLAEALYHVESAFQSTGISSAKAMAILKIGAEGAKIGGANLTDVMNALDAAVVSGIPGVQNIAGAMGGLLKIVGSGDMTMQDFANAASTGILATAKVYGASLNDVGAALATFGDNNIRGQNAATDLRMSIMDLTKQAAPGAAALAKIGITAGQLGTDMQTGGLNKALTDLHAHLLAAGDGGTKMGEVLEDAFTKKSSAPLAILLSQFDRFQGKYADMAGGANSFASAWARTQATFSQQLDEIGAGAKALGIRLGEALIPVLQKIIGWVKEVVGWFGKHKAVTEALGKALKDVLAGALLIVIPLLATIYSSALATVGVFIAVSLAVGALARWLVNLYEHNDRFRKFVDGLVADAKRIGTEVVGAIKTAFGAIDTVIKDFVGGFTEHESVIDGINGWREAIYTFGLNTRFVLEDIRNAIMAVPRYFEDVVHAIDGFLDQHRKSVQQIEGDLRAIWHDVEGVVEDLVPIFKGVFEIIGGIVFVAVKVIEDLWARFGHTFLDNVVTAVDAVMQILRGAFEVIKGIFDVFAGIFSGNWSKVWTGIKEIFGGVWNIILGLLKYALDVIENGFEMFAAVVSAIWDPIWDGISSVVSTAFDAVLDFLEGVGGDIVGVFNDANVWLVKVGKAIVEGLFNGIEFVTSLPERFYNLVVSQGGLFGIGKKLLADLINGLLVIEPKVIGFFTALPGEILGVLTSANTWLITTGKDVITGLVDSLVAQAKAVWTFFIHLPATILSYLRSAASWLANVGKLIITGLWTGIKAWWAAEVKFFIDMPGTILSYLQDAGTWLYDVGEDVIKGLINGIEDQAKNIGGSMKNIAGSVIDGAKHFLGIGSPSKVMADEVGKWIPPGIAMGINANASAVKFATASLAAQAQAGMRGSVTGSGALASAGGASAGGSGAPVYVTNINVQGSVLDYDGLFKAVQKASMQYGSRNSRNGPQLAFRR